MATLRKSRLVSGFTQMLILLASLAPWQKPDPQPRADILPRRRLIPACIFH
jgi:hypothetical protein